MSFSITVQHPSTQILTDDGFIRAPASCPQLVVTYHDITLDEVDEAVDYLKARLTERARRNEAAKH